TASRSPPSKAVKSTTGIGHCARRRQSRSISGARGACTSSTMTSGRATPSLCLGWPDRSRDVSPYFLGHPDRIGPKGVVTILVEIAYNSPKNALDSPKSVVIMVLMYPRTVKVRSKSGTVNEYVRVVEAYREGSKVKQRVVADLGRKDLLLEVLPKLRRLLTGEDRDPADPQFGEAPDW